MFFFLRPVASDGSIGACSFLSPIRLLGRAPAAGERPQQRIRSRRRVCSCCDISSSCSDGNWAEKVYPNLVVPAVVGTLNAGRAGALPIGDATGIDVTALTTRVWRDAHSVRTDAASTSEPRPSTTGVSVARP
jgi:hypothetical protein